MGLGLELTVQDYSNPRELPMIVTMYDSDTSEVYRSIRVLLLYNRLESQISLEDFDGDFRLLCDEISTPFVNEIVWLGDTATIIEYTYKTDVTFNFGQP